MGIRHTSKFGESVMPNSRSVYDYGHNQDEVNQCSLLKYSISFPISIENEARSKQPEYELSRVPKSNKTRKKNKIVSFNFDKILFK